MTVSMARLRTSSNASERGESEGAPSSRSREVGGLSAAGSVGGERSAGACSLGLLRVFSGSPGVAFTSDTHSFRILREPSVPIGRFAPSQTIETCAFSTGFGMCQPRRPTPTATNPCKASDTRTLFLSRSTLHSPEVSNVSIVRRSAAGPPAYSDRSSLSGTRNLTPTMSDQQPVGQFSSSTSDHTPARQRQQLQICRNCRARSGAVSKHLQDDGGETRWTSGGNCQHCRRSHGDREADLQIPPSAGDGSSSKLTNPSRGQGRIVNPWDRGA
jgi:hypothetical protein